LFLSGNICVFAHHYLAQRLRISGAILLLPLCAVTCKQGQIYFYGSVAKITVFCSICISQGRHSAPFVHYLENRKIHMRTYCTHKHTHTHTHKYLMSTFVRNIFQSENILANFSRDRPTSRKVTSIHVKHSVNYSI